MVADPARLESAASSGGAPGSLGRQHDGGHRHRGRRGRASPHMPSTELTAAAERVARQRRTTRLPSHHRLRARVRGVEAPAGLSRRWCAATTPP